MFIKEPEAGLDDDEEEESKISWLENHKTMMNLWSMLSFASCSLNMNMQDVYLQL